MRDNFQKSDLSDMMNTAAAQDLLKRLQSLPLEGQTAIQDALNRGDLNLARNLGIFWLQKAENHLPLQVIQEDPHHA